eukprot:2286703-Amphidinium_carterae.1
MSEDQRFLIYLGCLGSSHEGKLGETHALFREEEHSRRKSSHTVVSALDINFCRGLVLSRCEQTMCTWMCSTGTGSKVFVTKCTAQMNRAQRLEGPNLKQHRRWGT